MSTHTLKPFRIRQLKLIVRRVILRRALILFALWNSTMSFAQINTQLTTNSMQNSTTQSDSGLSRQKIVAEIELEAESVRNKNNQIFGIQNQLDIKSYLYWQDKTAIQFGFKLYDKPIDSTSEKSKSSKSREQNLDSLQIGLRHTVESDFFSSLKMDLSHLWIRDKNTSLLSGRELELQLKTKIKSNPYFLTKAKLKFNESLQRLNLDDPLRKIKVEVSPTLTFKTIDTGVELETKAQAWNEQTKSEFNLGPFLHYSIAHFDLTLQQNFNVYSSESSTKKWAWQDSSTTSVKIEYKLD